MNSSDVAFQRVRDFFNSLGSARRGRGSDAARHGNAGVRRSSLGRVPRKTLNEIAPQVYLDWPLACERRRAEAAANGASTSRDGVIRVAGPSGAAQEEMDTSSDGEDSSSHHVTETSSRSCSSGAPRRESGERASHASTAENTIL